MISSEPRELAIDLETYSATDISAGVHKYAEDPDFQVLLIGYKYSDETEVHCIDCTRTDAPEQDPKYRHFLEGLLDPKVIKTAYNAAFERTCLARMLDRPMPPEEWRDTMILAVQLGLPRSLAAVGAALGLPADEQKDRAGKALIRYFCKPCKPTRANGGRTRNLPEQAPEKWELFIGYNKQDVVTEQAILRRIGKKNRPIPAEEHLWDVDQNINDRGVLLDTDLAGKIVGYSDRHTADLLAEARQLTGLDNPNSLSQLKTWLAGEGIDAPTLTKDDVAGLLKGDLPANVRRVLEIRQSLGKTSVKKYQTMLDVACTDHRARGLLQFYGGHTGRWAGRALQPQNLARNTMPDAELDEARALVKAGDFDTLEMLYGDHLADTFSQLVRTGFIPSPGCRFVVSDFSAIEARVIAWIAGEEWRLDVFRKGGDIYCESASRIYHVPVVKHGINGNLRQKGKIAELALGYGGSVGSMKSMDKSGSVPEEEMPGIVKQWRAESPHIVRLWHSLEHAAIACTDGAGNQSVPIPGASPLICHMALINGTPVLRIRLPGGRDISYWDPLVKDSDMGPRLTYMEQNQTTRKWERTETYGGKLAENCLAEGTLVITDEGLVPIEQVTKSMKLWDGVEWAAHDGLSRKGIQPVIDVDGVRMTADHRIFTEEGWRLAGESKGFKRHKLQWDQSTFESGIRWTSLTMDLQMSVLRKAFCPELIGNTKEKDKVVRLRPQKADRTQEKVTRNVGYADIQRLAQHEGAVRDSNGSSLEELWRPRDPSMQALVGEFRELLRGYEPDVQEGADAGQDQCKRKLRTEQLPLGDRKGAGPEPENKPRNRYSMGADDRLGGSGEERNRRDDNHLQTGSWDPERIMVRETGSSEPVFDLINAGPRHRFYVMSARGPMLVHNCVQSVARDCLAEKMTALEARGYHVVFHVHDEMIFDVPREDTDAARVIDEAMAAPIRWAPGLPLKGGTYECDFYRKD